MRNQSMLNILLSLLCAAALFGATTTSGSAAAAEPPTTGQLQQQVDALSKQLGQLQNTTDPAAREQAMQQHWLLMQEHMRTARMMPGMSASGCADWMMMDPSMMGPGMMGQGGMAGCDWMGHGMMGPGMMGKDMMGPRMMEPGMGRWGMPSSMSPDAYGRHMQGTMQQMRTQMAAIAAEKDPARRKALIREHYESMYRNMQTMRGMGWMWAPNTQSSLPDAGSPGSQLVARYCSQCHATPAPSLHTSAEWSQVTSRMREHIRDLAGGAVPDLKTPSASELDAITEYLGKHGAAVR